MFRWTVTDGWQVCDVNERSWSSSIYSSSPTVFVNGLYICSRHENVHHIFWPCLSWTLMWYFIQITWRVHDPILTMPCCTINYALALFGSCNDSITDHSTKIELVLQCTITYAQLYCRCMCKCRSTPSICRWYK